MEVPHRFYLDAFRADESRVLEKRGPVSLNLRHDGGMGPDQPRAFGSQSRGLLELSLDLEAECLRGPETPGSLANGTRAAQEAFQAWSGPVSGDLDQAELANRQYPAPRPVRLQLLFQSSSQFLAVLLVLQVDEIYDQNPTEIPEPDLSDYFPCSLHVGGQRRLFEPGVAAHVFPGVHVDGHQGLRGMDHEIASRGEPNSATERPLNLLFDAHDLENRSPALISLQARHQMRGVGAQEHAALFQRALVVHHHPANLFREKVPENSHGETFLTVEAIGSGCARRG